MLLKSHKKIQALIKHACVGLPGVTDYHRFSQIPEASLYVTVRIAKTFIHLSVLNFRGKYEINITVIFFFYLFIFTVDYEGLCSEGKGSGVWLIQFQYRSQTENSFFKAN